MGQKISAAVAERNAFNTERKALFQEKAQFARAFVVKEQAVQKLQAELLAIYQSRLWRWTQPLRKLFRLFQQPK
jgi:hypothetical protein